MKSILLFTFLFTPTLLFSQTSIYRSESPLSFKIGLQGIGIDIAAGNCFGIDVTSWFIMNSLNARFYILEKNGSPFIGVGVGEIREGFGGGSEQQWTVGFVGWEHSYKVFLIQIIAQIPIERKYSYGYSPFLVNLNLGARIN